MSEGTVYIPKLSELLSAQDYQKELINNRDNIAGVKFIPPTLGKPGFGLFQVQYRTAVLRKVSWTK